MNVIAISGGGGWASAAVYLEAARLLGAARVESAIGVEPSGDPFNSIRLNADNHPFNPMVNAGAIATADLIKGRDFPERITRLLAMFSRFCGRDVYIDNAVFT